MTSLTVIVPVFNEEQTVQESLSRLDSVDIVSKIIIVDDCSSDNSNTLIQEFIQDKKKYLLLKTPNNSGKGKAIEIAQKYIETDYLVIHDADLEYFPEDFYSMYEKIDNNNLVLGSRFIGNLIRNNLYTRTLFANYFLSKLFSLIYRNKVTDVASCYKMIPKDFFKKIKIESSGFEFEIEVLAKYLNDNDKISEVPIQYNGRSYAEGKKIKSIDGLKYIYWMFKCKK